MNEFLRAILDMLETHILTRWAEKARPADQKETLGEQTALPSLADGIASTISSHTENTREGQNLAKLAAAVKEQTEKKKAPNQSPEPTSGLPPGRGSSGTLGKICVFYPL